VIGDLLLRTLRAPNRLAPLASLGGDNAAGSRMPEITCAAITPDIARRLAACCPTAAMRRGEGADGAFFELDYALCIGCGRCAAAAPEAVAPARSLPRCGLQRAQLLRRWSLESGIECSPPPAAVLPRLDRWLGRAVNIRQLDAGSCNGCEAEISALNNPYYDLERLGAHFVASPKHADLLLVTGPVTRNMEEAVRLTYEAVPAPKLVVAVGACGCSGGVFASSPAVAGPVDRIIPVDAYIPGCPPTPAMLVTGLAAVLRIAAGARYRLGRPAAL
jgi:Ni,Fe-hydrogenase III small subunit